MTDIDDEKIRSRSPRFPSMNLSDALVRVDKLYEKENKHEVPMDVVAKDIGYSGASNGAAKKTIASLSYYGLIRRAANGKLAVSPTYEKYKFAPEQSTKSGFLYSWLQEPKIFLELLNKYKDGLPSDAALIYDLIEMGFTPDSAKDSVRIFRESVAFVQSEKAFPVASQEDTNSDDNDETDHEEQDKLAQNGSTAPKADKGGQETQNFPPDYDTIPVRLPRGRKAMLMVPTPFYNSDKLFIKAQLDALYAEEDE